MVVLRIFSYCTLMDGEDFSLEVLPVLPNERFPLFLNFLDGLAPDKAAVVIRESSISHTSTLFEDCPPSSVYGFQARISTSKDYPISSGHCGHVVFATRIRIFCSNKFAFLCGLLMIDLRSIYLMYKKCCKFLAITFLHSNFCV